MPSARGVKADVTWWSRADISPRVRRTPWLRDASVVAVEVANTGNVRLRPGG